MNNGLFVHGVVYGFGMFPPGHASFYSLFGSLFDMLDKLPTRWTSPLGREFLKDPEPMANKRNGTQRRTNENQ